MKTVYFFPSSAVECGNLSRTQIHTRKASGAKPVIEPIFHFLLAFLLLASSAAAATFDSAVKFPGPVYSEPLVVRTTTGEILSAEPPYNFPRFTKFAPSGQKLWQTNLAVPFPASMEVDPAGNIYLAGSALMSTEEGRFNAFEGGSFPVQGEGCVYVAKLDTNAVVQWVRLSGGSDGAGPQTLFFDSSNNYYIAGHYWRQSQTFGGNTLSVPPIENQPNIFLTKYSPEGQVAWARAGEAVGSMLGAAIINSSGDIYLGGRLVQSLSFDGLALAATDAGTGFLIKMSSAGAVTWGTNTPAAIGALAIDPEQNLVSAYGTEAIAKWNSSGRLLWEKRIRYNDSSQRPQLAIDSDGNALFAAAYSGQFWIDTFTLKTRSQWETFVVKLSSSGEVLWGTQTVGKSFYSPTATNDRRSLTLPSLLSTERGRVILSGVFQGTVGFGAVTLNGRDYGSNWDLFTAEINDLPPIPSLAVTKLTNEISVQWPASSSGFALETSERLGVAASWIPATNAITISSNQNTIRFEPASRYQFFRLRKP